MAPQQAKSFRPILSPLTKFLKRGRLLSMAKDTIIKTLVKTSVSEEFAKHFPVYEEKMLDKIEKMLTNFRSDLTNMKLEILGELEKIRQEQTILNGRSVKINKIEDEVDKLKGIHPKYSHVQI